METEGIRFLSDIPWYVAVVWYYVAFLIVLGIYAFRKIPKDERVFTKWVISNRLRLYLGLGISVLLSAVMFAPDAFEFLTVYIPIQSTFMTPLLIGGAVAGFLIAAFQSKDN